MGKNIFDSEDEVAALTAAFVQCTLGKAQWTHGAHFAACLHLVTRQPDVVPETDMPGMIRRYNESVGGVNSDDAGYHETITQASIAATRDHWANSDHTAPLHVVHAALMAGPLGRTDWLFTYWTRDLVMGTAARRAWVAPDIAPLPFPVRLP